VFHITEEQIKSQIDADVYEAEVGVVDMVLDVEDISAAIREVRLSNGAAD
jgi:betaine reductase